jgi:hypothetical protein
MKSKLWDLMLCGFGYAWDGSDCLGVGQGYLGYLGL